MSKAKIQSLIESRVQLDGLMDTRIKGLKLYRITESIRCAPAVYEPAVISIVSGSKKAVLDGKSYIYDKERYMCCTMSMPVEAGTPDASPDNPLLGVYLAIDPRVMTEVAIGLESAAGAIANTKGQAVPQGITLAAWDEDFTDALFRLLQLEGREVDCAVLLEGRIRELYYTILKGEAGLAARRAFGVGNEIARAIQYLSSNVDASVTIDALAEQVGMSRAVFHRKFKQATSMSPIQFLKSMRLNNAAMRIAEGASVSSAAMEVGYVSSSQFSREFKRLYGQSPRDWSSSVQQPSRMM